MVYRPKDGEGVDEGKGAWKGKNLGAWESEQKKISGCTLSAEDCKKAAASHMKAVNCDCARRRGTGEVAGEGGKGLRSVRPFTLQQQRSGIKMRLGNAWKHSHLSK